MIEQALVNSIRKIKAPLAATDCFITFKEKHYFVTVRHAFKQGIKNGDKVTIDICDKNWEKLTGVVYLDEAADIALIEADKSGKFIHDACVIVDKGQEEDVSNNKYFMMGFENQNDGCEEHLFYQELPMIATHKNGELKFFGVAMKGYSGSPIFTFFENHNEAKFCGFLKSRIESEMMSEKGTRITHTMPIIICASNRAILEILNLSVRSR